MIRRKKIKKEEKDNSQITDHKIDIIQDEPLINESAEGISIEEFIEIKKLQNRLLEKMINSVSKKTRSNSLKNRRLV